MLIQSVGGGGGGGIMVRSLTFGGCSSFGVIGRLGDIPSILCQIFGRHREGPKSWVL